MAIGGVYFFNRGKSLISVRSVINDAMMRLTAQNGQCRLDHQLQFGEGAAKRHERQVEVFDGGHPECQEYT